jgi:hypothetical protein
VIVVIPSLAAAVHGGALLSSSLALFLMNAAAAERPHRDRREDRYEDITGSL